MRYYIVYKTTHIASGKTYIGKHETVDIDDGYLGSGKLLKRAISKYGADAFTKEVLHIFEDRASMDAMEASIVTEEFCSSSDNYNLCPGGNGGFGYINAQYWTPESRREHNSRVSGFKKLTPEQRTAFGAMGGTKTKHMQVGIHDPCQPGASAWRGSKHTEATKAAMSRQRTGTKTGTDNVSNMPEVRAKRSATLKARIAEGTFAVPNMQSETFAGSKWITNGERNRRVKVDAEFTMPDGWRFGSTQK